MLDWILAWDTTLFLKINNTWVSPFWGMFFVRATDPIKEPIFYILLAMFLFWRIFSYDQLRYQSTGLQGWRHTKWVWRFFDKSTLKRALGLFCICSVGFGISDMTTHRVLKPLVKRDRPMANQQLEDQRVVLRTTPHYGWSFPSVHAANAFTVANLLGGGIRLLFAKGGLGFFCYFLAGLIAYSRVYVGVHFPLDVLCGALFGILLSELLFLPLTRVLGKRAIWMTTTSS